MPSMTVDLADLDDLLHARSVIDSRIAKLGGAPDSEADADDTSPQSDPADEGDEGDELSAADTTWFADQLWNRIRSDNTWELIRAFTEFDGQFSLEEVAEKLGLEPKAVRTRKFRLGRTEHSLGHRLLNQAWSEDDWHNLYEMDPAVRDRLRELLREADEE